MANKYKRKKTYSEGNLEDRWRKFTYDKIIARNKTSLDVFCLKNKNLVDLNNLLEPDILAIDVIELRSQT